jgi:hypothetical protein
MGHVELAGCLETDGGTLERVRYFPRQLLTADDLTADSEYFREKMRRHNRHLHGWGTVCGLAVSAAPTAELPWRVRISAGYALGPYGDEIYVAKPLTLDLARCGPGAVTDPCAPEHLHKPSSTVGGAIFVAIKYAECLSRPVRALSAGCGCEDEACEYSRVRDSFQIECLAELPASHQPQPDGLSLCDLINLKQLPVCPPCPAEPWVILAKITLPASPQDKIAEDQIDNFSSRRQVFSTAVLQDQLIKCCCKPKAKEPARVVSVAPPDGTQFNLLEGRPTPPNFPRTIPIAFSKSLRAASVNASTIQVTVSEADRPARPVAGRITYDDASRTAQFTPEQGFPGSVNGNVYRIQVRGDASNPITDVDDLALDGNGDGSPGGNFESRFTVLFVIG